MKLVIWRGPERPGHYKDGDIIRHLAPGQVGPQDPVHFEIVECDDVAFDVSLADYETAGERWPASARKLRRFTERMGESLETPDTAKNRRRYHWDGTNIRNKRYAV